MDKLRIIVTGLIGQHHAMGGVTWDYLQYLIGLQSLGHEVYYFEDSGEWPYKYDGGPSGDDWDTNDCAQNINHINDVLRRHGLQEQWAYKFGITEKWFGLSDTKRKDVLASADMLINVSGTIHHPEDYGSLKRLVYIDSDPGFTEIKMMDVEFSKRVLAHDVYFSFGELLNERTSVSGIKWLPTRSPIVVNEWDTISNLNNSYTTIMNWTSYKPLRRNGKIYSQKDTEIAKFIDLPTKLVGSNFEVAMPKLFHANWKSEGLVDWDQYDTPWDLLKSHGWKVVNAQDHCNTIDKYRSYIQQSRGEWSVAKGGYVADHSGWFSCRSGCYLASSRPVVVQSTGFEEVIPTGDGLFNFNNQDEAIDAIEKIESNYEYHCKKAREIANEYLSSDIVLNNLINQALR